MLYGNKTGTFLKVEKDKSFIINYLSFYLVPRPGVEPGWVSPLVFETSASTDSAIWATFLFSCAKVGFFLEIPKEMERFFLFFLFAGRRAESSLGEERDAYSVEMFLDFALILQVNGRKVGVDGFFY